MKNLNFELIDYNLVEVITICYGAHMYGGIYIDKVSKLLHGLEPNLVKATKFWFKRKHNPFIDCEFELKEFEIAMVIAECIAEQEFDQIEERLVLAKIENINLVRLNQLVLNLLDISPFDCSCANDSRFFFPSVDDKIPCEFNYSFTDVSSIKNLSADVLDPSIKHLFYCSKCEYCSSKPLLEERISLCHWFKCGEQICNFKSYSCCKLKKLLD